MYQNKLQGYFSIKMVCPYLPRPRLCDSCYLSVFVFVTSTMGGGFVTDGVVSQNNLKLFERFFSCICINYTYW